MADTHPYISGAGNIVQAVNHLRNSFPATVNAETFKRLGIASNSESYLINVLRFVGALDADGKKTKEATSVFSKHQDSQFTAAFGKMVKTAYKDLFDLHADKAWDLDVDSLITFFRSVDQTSSTIGGRQAKTFQALAGLSGHGDLPEATKRKTGSKKKAAKKTTMKKAAKKKSVKTPVGSTENANHTILDRDVGLTVRVEINLPADGDQETYDRIFKSIRENLLNG